MTSGPGRGHGRVTGADYLREHGVDLDVAEGAGVQVNSCAIAYRYLDGDGEPFYRWRHLTGEHAGRTLQPAGRPLCLYWPAGRRGGAVWLAEGEPDALAAQTALCGEELPVPLQGLIVAAIPGTGMPAKRAAEELRDAGATAVYLALDGDDPGRKASGKISSALAEVGIEALTVKLPDGADGADVLVAAGDPTALLAELVAEADAAVEEVPREEAGRAEVEPLPNDVIAGMLGVVADTLDRYVVLPGEHERVALTLFVAHTWATEGAHATPYMLVISPEKRSGKSRLLQVLELLVARPWGVIGASEAAVFRKIAKAKPTMLLDEIDAIFGSNSERTEPLRAILNAGNRPGATVARCVGENKDVEDFPIFCAKVLAGIDSGHRIPDTIRDRSVTIAMRRKTDSEPVDPLRHRDADAEAQPIRQGLQRWGAGAVDPLRDAYPDLPAKLDDRAAEAWEPLLAIADMAGGDWPERARLAAVALSGEEDRDEVTTGTLLLGAIREAFGESERIATTDLLATINGDEETPFGGWKDGRGLDSRTLARLLKPYGVKPKKLRFGEELARGYLRDDLSDAWSRWLPTRTEAEQPEQPEQDSRSGTQEPLGQANVPLVPLVPAETECNGTVTATEGEEAELRRIAEKLGGAA